MASLAQTSLDIDTLTIATLYNRGSLLSSGQAYVPIVSSFTFVDSLSKVAFSKWLNKPTANIYDSIFYEYKSGSRFISSISSIDSIETLISSSIYLVNLQISTFTNTYLSTLGTYSTIGLYTLSTLSNTYIYESTNVSSNYLSTTLYFSSIIPGISTTIFPPSTFYDKLFAPTASTLIQLGIQYYIPRNTISDYTYNAINNSTPLLSGAFGSNNPLPYYWQGTASRFIGPGISSISTIFQNTENYPFYLNISSGFHYLLSSISVGFTYSNSSLGVYRNAIVNTATNATFNIDGGSSISTSYYNFNSTFISTLNYASTLGEKVSTLSTFVVKQIQNAIIPSLNGFSIAQYISTSDILLNSNQELYISSLNSSMGSVRTLIGPFTVFSTIVNSTISTQTKFVNNVNFFPGLFQISDIAFSTFTPFYTSTSVSTNYNGFLNLSSYEKIIFSTFSTLFPYILGQSMLSSLSTLNLGISTLSTSINLDTSTIYGRPVPFITAPGISSMFSNFSTNIVVSYYKYSDIISSMNNTLVKSLSNVNSIEGLSTLSAAAYNYTSSIKWQTSSMYIYTSSGFNSEYLAIESTNTSIIKEITTNVSNFISVGISSYAITLSTFGYISSLVNNENANINSLVYPPNGSIYMSFSSFDYLPSTTLHDLIPFAGSTVFYSMLPTITNYSTSLYAKDALVPTYITRSTTFYSINLTSSINVAISSFSNINVGIQTNSLGLYNFAINGAVSIQPSSINNLNPTIQMNNFQVYSYVNPQIFVPSTAILSYASTISFNSSNLTINRLYNNNAFGRVGINLYAPGYSLDIGGNGDARKPTGTTWITGSDYRIKESISAVNYQEIIGKISSLRLVSYKWEESYRKCNNLCSTPIIGFLSQEVKNVFPNSVTESLEYGLSNFMCLDTDQIIKAKFALTQYLIQRVSSLQARLKYLMKES